MKHYAGAVTYTTDGWLAKNKDLVSADVSELLRTSPLAPLHTPRHLPLHMPAAATTVSGSCFTPQLIAVKAGLKM